MPDLHQQQHEPTGNGTIGRLKSTSLSHRSPTLPGHLKLMFVLGSYVGQNGQTRTMQCMSLPGPQETVAEWPFGFFEALVQFLLYLWVQVYRDNAGVGSSRTLGFYIRCPRYESHGHPPSTAFNARDGLKA